MHSVVKIISGIFAPLLWVTMFWVTVLWSSILTSADTMAAKDTQKHVSVKHGSAKPDSKKLDSKKPDSKKPASKKHSPGIDFTGAWEIDYQQSEEPNAKIRRLYAQMKSKAERELQRARSDRNYHIDSRVSNPQTIIGLGRLAEKIAAATVLNIKQYQDHIIIKRNDDFALICDFNWGELTESPLGKESCRWQKNRLSFLIVLPDGLIVRHLFSIGSSQRQLQVATTVEMSGGNYPFTLNRVYVPLDPSESMYDCKYTIANQTTCSLNRRSN